jgi:IS30 family transposase
MIGKNHKSAIATMVDRTSKETKIVKLNSRNAKHTSRKIAIKMKATNKPINSITFDNGKEFSEHKKIAKHLNTSFYFTDPYIAFQRGTN